jgi:hypothetical protein
MKAWFLMVVAGIVVACVVIRAFTYHSHHHAHRVKKAIRTTHQDKPSLVSVGWEE